MALNIINVAEIIERTIKLQLKFVALRTTFAIRTLVLTFRSEAFCLSVFSSCSSRAISSLNVGLRGSINRPGVPGTLRALLIGDIGVSGTSMLLCFSRSLCEMYPNPMSDGCG